MSGYPYGRVGAVEPSTLARVLGYLGLTMAFTALGAVFGPAVGPIGVLVGWIGSLVCLIALQFLRERAPVNLLLLFGFGLLLGLGLGETLASYVAAGMGDVVLSAAGTTAAITLAAGGIGYTTKRDLTGLGGVLFLGLIGVVIASVIGIFFRFPLYWVVISAISALLFTGFIVYDLNRIARAGRVSQGDAILLAVSVFLDIVNLFLSLLRLFSSARR
jgi:FtsH-binding integral membrane protein